MKYIRQILLTLGLVALVTLSWLAPLDAPATEQVDAGLKRALVSFATARALNGVISVLQGTEVDVQPGGLGATFAPGQIVAPINELVKHFADLMLMASVAFGIQKLLISISAYWAISLVLTAAAFAWATFLFLKKPAPVWISKLLVILLMLRFAVPVATLGTDFLSQKFMSDEYELSQSEIAKTTGHADTANPQASPATNGGWFNNLTAALPKLPNFTATKEAVEKSTEHMVKLMAIFLLQTLLMPLLLLWALYAVAKGVFDSGYQARNS